jgi:hypothetical protein
VDLQVDTKVSEGLKMQTVCASETMVSTCKSTRRYYPEDQHRRLYLKFFIFVVIAGEQARAVWNADVLYDAVRERNTYTHKKFSLFRFGDESSH